MPSQQTPMRYYHYTSRVAAQMIVAARRIVPGPGGAVYLTDQLYRTGAEAADWLGIPPVGPTVYALSGGLVQLTKPVDILCVIPADRLGEGLGELEVADEVQDPDGVVVYSGGGRQYRYRGSIDISGLSWQPLGLP